VECKHISEQVQLTLHGPCPCIKRYLYYVTNQQMYIRIVSYGCEYFGMLRHIKTHLCLKVCGRKYLSSYMRYSHKSIRNERNYREPQPLEPGTSMSRSCVLYEVLSQHYQKRVKLEETSATRTRNLYVKKLCPI